MDNVAVEALTFLAQKYFAGKKTDSQDLPGTDSLKENEV